MIDTEIPSSLRRKADAVFEQTSPYPGNGFLHHCKRLFHFTSMLAAKRGIMLPPDLAYMIAMWHDLGLVSERDTGHNYLQRSRALFYRESQGLALPEFPAEKVDQCLLYNHRVLPVPNLCEEAECFRKAVIIEHSRGVLRFGLERARVREVFAQYPRDNFDRVLLDFTWRTIRREPLTLVSGVFFGHAVQAAA